MPTPAPLSAEGVGHCPHCNAEVAWGDDFCCTGCELAYSIVHGAGLDAYYDRRAEPGHRPEPLAGGWSEVHGSPVDGGEEEVFLAVDGLRCASCTWVVERLLERSEGVSTASVSYATGRCAVRYNPATTSPAELARTIAAVGYKPRPVDAAPPPDDLLARLGVAAFATANLMLLAASLYAGWFDGMAERYEVLFRWGSLALATPIATWSAAPFFEGALRGLRTRTIGMDFPIALAVTVLFGHGIVQTLLGAEGYLDSLGMLVTLLLVGRVLERRGRRSASEAAARIAATLPQTARRRTVSGVEDVELSHLVPGDIVELGAGQSIPADGVVVDGSAQVGLALLTGESDPVTAETGAELVAGAVVHSGALGLRVERVGEDTLAMRMAAAVRDASDRPLPPTPGDHLAPWFTAATVVLALVGGLVWGVFSGTEQGLQVAVAVLVVACPCALGLSAPLSIASGLGAVARRGVVFQDGGRLLALGELKTLAVDKTGTVTSGEPEVVEADDETLVLAASLERSSQHPVARALLAEARSRHLPLRRPTHSVEDVGSGVRGTFDGVAYRVRGDGPGRVVLERAGEVIGHIRLADRARPDAEQALAALRNAGLRTVMLSGDHPDVCARIGGALGLDPILGGLSPEDKAAWLDDNGPAIFVGDGLNDGVALAHAGVGLAMHSGVASSVMLADGVVSQPALRPVVAAIAGARATREVLHRNLRRAVGYNLLAVGAALAGLVNPLVAAVLMPLSSAMVIAGALSVPRRQRALEDRWTSSLS